MSRRERAEDLGVLNCKLLDLTEKYDEFHSTLPWQRAKDACELFEDLNDEEKSEFIHKFAYYLQGLEEDIYECLSVARGDEE